MKKSSVIITSVVCGGLLLLGCATPSTPANVAKSLESNLNNLTTTINKLDTIDNSYLSNPDIYPITNSITTPAPKSNKSNIAKISTNDFDLFVPIAHQKRKIAKTMMNLETEQTEINTQDVVINNFESTQDLANNDATTNEDTVSETTGVSDETNSTQSNLSTPQTIIYYYESKPITYAPRYARQNVENEDYLTNYINKVKNLYAITNDAIVANNELSNYKDNVIAYCVEIKDLNSAIKDGSFVPSNQQIAALNNYIDDIKITIKRIKKCNGDLSDEVDSINKTDVGGITAGIDVLNSNYLSVLNHLDTRITYLKNALTTLEQIKYLLQEAQNIVETNPEVSELVETEEIITPEISEQNTDYSNAETEETTNTNENEQNLDLNNSENANENNINQTEDNITENNITETEDIDNTNNVDNIETLEEDRTDKNIDTYLNTNNNLDTYLNSNTSPETNISEENLNTNNATNLETANNNTTVVPNNTNNAPIINNGVNNGYALPTDEEKINAPNGTFQNGIITQNNLNNGVNNGVNGTYSGYSSSYNYPTTNGDNTRSNKNVDTYGYNTMIDMLNHGTVNNGINTLSVTEETSTKPNMVSSDTVINEEINNEECEDCKTIEDCENCLDNCEECKKEIESCEDCITETEERLTENCSEENVEVIENTDNLNLQTQEDYNAELL